MSFLTVYNPSFGQTDEAAHEQIFYYFSRQEGDAGRHAALRERKQRAASVKKSAEDRQNERLRQVGLARGMVEFAK